MIMSEDIMNEKFKSVSKLLSMLKVSGKKYDVEKIKEAYLYADELHAGQFRKSGEPYIYHPIAVAEITAALGLDTDSVCAAFLHDTVEDCPDRTNPDIIKKRFGSEVSMLVDGLTKISTINVEDKEEAQIENIRRMILAMSKDIRVIFIKLCDRLHNMRTLYAKPENKRRITALETMHVYAPLAHRLGIQKIKQELENLALSYLDPIGYDEVKKHIERKYGQTQDLLDNVRAHITENLEKYNINFTIEGRVKTVYSIYRKMFNQSKEFDEIYDFYALRIIVETELECYTALGIIHEMYKSMPGRFKDYISTPKPNMYQSLHTTVIGREGIPFEVQIRTREMHHIAEYGIAAHWKYKSGAQSREEIDKKLQWISKLIDSEDGTIDADDFMHSLKIDIFHDETFVFTPKGDVIALPQGATLIDFAYAIHSAVGNKMVGAKINGMIAPIDKCPQNGEIVEILTSASSKGPSRDWLKIVKTGEARNKIRQWFKKEKRSENIVIGRAELDKEINRLAKNAADAQRHEIITRLSHRIGMQGPDDLCNSIGYGGLAISKISTKLKDEIGKVIRPETEELKPLEVEKIKTAPSPAGGKSGGIIVDGQKGCAVKFAKCCNPLPGDSIIGFITKGYGVSIHKRDCPNVINGMKSEEFFHRWIHAEWDLADIRRMKSSSYEAVVQIFAEDSISLIADVTMALADMKVSITQINTRKHDNSDVIINLKFACKDTNHYNSVVARLKSIPHVNNIVRGLN